MNWMSMIPVDMIEGMIRDNIDEGITGLIEWAHQKVQLEPGQVPAVTFFEGRIAGKPTVCMAVQVLDAKLQPVRMVTWADLRVVIKTLPIGDMMKEIRRRDAVQGKVARKLEKVTERLKRNPLDAKALAENAALKAELDAMDAAPSPWAQLMHTNYPPLPIAATDTKQLAPHTDGNETH